MIVTFDAAAVRKLLDLSMTSKNRRPTFDQFIRPAFWRDDLSSERRAVLEAGINKDGFCFEVRLSDLDQEKIGVGLWLVGNRGIALQSNASIEEIRAAAADTLVYADECNPEKMRLDLWREVRGQAFGDEDRVVFLTEESLAPALVEAGETLCLDLTPDSVSVLAPTRDPMPN